MKFHAIDVGSVKCPFCGMPRLGFEREAHHGDLYRCTRAMGGCGRTIVHRRQKLKPACGLVPLLNFARFGDWKQCVDGGRGAS